MKLDEIQMSPDTMQAIAGLIVERMRNLAIQIRSGAAPLDAIMGEMCVIEAKLDALMLMMEDKQVMSFKMFDAFLKKSAEAGAAQAVNIRQQMAEMAKKRGPSGIVKPDGTPP